METAQLPGFFLLLLASAFFPPGRWGLPISEFGRTDRKNKRVPRFVVPPGAGCALNSRVPLLRTPLLNVKPSETRPQVLLPGAAANFPVHMNTGLS